MDVVFLDANVLFSAAYRQGAGLLRLWKLRDVTLVTSRYALAEAHRNLDGPARRKRLQRLIESVRLVPEAPDRPLPDGIELPEKDRPILQAAIGAGATHLLTGDITHFGPYLDRTVAGLRVRTPAGYLRERDRRGA